MNNILLSEGKSNSWYEVLYGAGILAEGSTILFEGFDDDLKRFKIVAESYIDEIGLAITIEDSERIRMKEIIF